MTTECIQCKGRQFKTFELYARHILDKHADDDIRVAWANEVLNPKVEEVVVQPPEDPTDEIDAQLAAILKPEVMKRLRGASNPKPKKTPKDKPDSEEAPKSNKKWTLLIGALIVLVIIASSLCHALYTS